MPDYPHLRPCYLRYHELNPAQAIIDVRTHPDLASRALIARLINVSSAAQFNKEMRDLTQLCVRLGYYISAKDLARNVLRSLLPQDGTTDEQLS